MDFHQHNSWEWRRKHTEADWEGISGEFDIFDVTVCVNYPRLLSDEHWNRIFFLIPNSRSQTGNCFTFQVSIQNAVNVKCTEIKWFLILIFFFPRHTWLSFKMITTHHLPTHCSSVRQQHEGCIPPTFASPHSGQCTLCRGSLPGEHNFIYLFIFSCPPTKTHQLNCPFCWFEIQ